MVFLDAYLVYSSKCRIPEVDPWTKEIEHLYRKYDYAPCSIYKPLTYVVNNRGHSAVLHIDREIEPQYSQNGVRCCFSYIFRIKIEGKRPDDTIRQTTVFYVFFIIKSTESYCECLAII